MNINELNRIQTINLDEKLKDVKYGAGTFKQILDNVYDNTIIPIINNEGTIVGISYDAKCASIIDDDVAKMKFEREYCGKDVMGWCLKALQLKANGNVVTEVIENDEKISVKLDNGGEMTIEDYSCDYSDEEEIDDLEYDDELPDHEEIEFCELENPYDKKEVLSYLRTVYDHYLARGANVQIEPCDEDQVVYVTNIEWGRKL